MRKYRTPGIMTKRARGVVASTVYRWTLRSIKLTSQYEVAMSDGTDFLLIAHLIKAVRERSTFYVT
jgi:hypothetical protein